MADMAIRQGALLAPYDRQIVTLQGRYEVEDIGPYGVMEELPDGRLVRVTRLVFLTLEDGVTVRLWVRPDEEMKRLNGAEVAATGRLIMPGPPPPSHVSAPDQAPSLIELTEIAAVQSR
ncbi:MAG: hypothetical protein JW797_06560 [Bradymonadales bacterium]|nr:hypothetical protein [Bradymonadales bacterium]